MTDYSHSNDSEDSSRLSHQRLEKNRIPGVTSSEVTLNHAYVVGRNDPLQKWK